MTFSKKYMCIVETRINGNYKSAKELTKKLTKKQLCEFMALIVCGHCDLLQDDERKRFFIVFINDCINE